MTTVIQPEVIRRIDNTSMQGLRGTDLAETLNRYAGAKADWLSRNEDLATMINDVTDEDPYNVIDEAALEYMS